MLPSSVLCKTCSSQFYVNRDGIVESGTSDPSSKSQEQKKPVSDKIIYIEDILKRTLTKAYRKVTTPKEKLFKFRKRDELDTLIESMQADTRQSAGELVGPLHNFGFLDKRLTHRLLIAWGLFNPYGPTWCSLTLAAVPEKNISIIYLKISNPFSIESIVHGWVREPVETETLMTLLFHILGQKGDGQIIVCAPTFIVCRSDLLNFKDIATLMYHAFTISGIKGLNEDCEAMRKHWLNPWDRTPSIGDMLMSFMEQNSLATPRDDKERGELLGSLASFLRKKMEVQLPLTSENFLRWFKLVTDPEHLAEECKQMWVAWEGAIEHVGKGLPSINAQDGLSFHWDLLRNRRIRKMLTLEKVKSLLGVKELPGSQWIVGQLIDSTEELIKENGEDWIRRNSDRLVEEWKMSVDALD